MYSESITIAPAAANDAAEVSVIVVAELVIVPFNVVVAEPVTVPPQEPAPQPADTVYVARPVVI
jgi:hypothetical protein